MKSHLECYTHVVTSKPCQSAQTRELVSVRNARGNDSSQQSAQFGHKAKLFSAKERYNYVTVICIYIYIYIYTYDSNIVLNIVIPSLMTSCKILATNFIISYPAVAPLKFKFLGLPTVSYFTSQHLPTP